MNHQSLEDDGVFPDQGRVHKKRIYHRDYMRKRRTLKREVTLSLTKAIHRRFKHEAKRHNLSIPAFIETAALHYLEQRYLVTDTGTIAAFAQRLRLATTDIQLIARHLKKLKVHELYHAYMGLKERIQFLESYVDDTLRNPPKL